MSQFRPADLFVSLYYVYVVSKPLRKRTSIPLYMIARGCHDTRVEFVTGFVYLQLGLLHEANLAVASHSFIPNLPDTRLCHSATCGSENSFRCWPEICGSN
jgi:hypothetical protein